MLIFTGKIRYFSTSTTVWSTRAVVDPKKQNTQNALRSQLSCRCMCCRALMDELSMNSRIRVLMDALRDVDDIGDESFSLAGGIATSNDSISGTILLVFLITHLHSRTPSAGPLRDHLSWMLAELW